MRSSKLYIYIYIYISIYFIIYYSNMIFYKFIDLFPRSFELLINLRYIINLYIYFKIFTISPLVEFPFILIVPLILYVFCFMSLINKIAISKFNMKKEIIKNNLDK